MSSYGVGGMCNVARRLRAVVRYDQTAAKASAWCNMLMFRADVARVNLGDLDNRGCAVGGKGRLLLPSPDIVIMYRIIARKRRSRDTEARKQETAHTPQ